MTIVRLLSRTWHGIVVLLILCAKFIVWCVIIISILPLLFVLAAQLYGWIRTGNWHPVPLSEFFQIVRLETPAVRSDSFINVLLASPATLLLFFGAVGSFLFKRLLDKLENHQRRLRLHSQQKELVGAIDRLLNSKS
jgi:uncharacterized membrane protein